MKQIVIAIAEKTQNVRMAGVSENAPIKNDMMFVSALKISVLHVCICTKNLG